MCDNTRSEEKMVKNEKMIIKEVNKNPKKTEKVVAQPIKEKKKEKVKVEKLPKLKRLIVEEKDFLQALKKAGGEARITPLYEAFDKKLFPEHVPSKLKTAIRVIGKKMAENSKVQAVHVDGKRAFTFREVKSQVA